MICPLLTAKVWYLRHLLHSAKKQSLTSGNSCRKNSVKLKPLLLEADRTMHYRQHVIRRRTSSSAERGLKTTRAVCTSCGLQISRFGFVVSNQETKMGFVFRSDDSEGVSTDRLSGTLVLEPVSLGRKDGHILIPKGCRSTSIEELSRGKGRRRNKRKRTAIG